MYTSNAKGIQNRSDARQFGIETQKHLHNTQDQTLIPNAQAKMTSNTLVASLQSANLLPSKVIPENFIPSVDLTVKFPSLTPAEGSLARVSQVKSAPTISTSNSNPSAQSYTFMLLDPDAPTPDDPKFAYWRHWVVTNIPSSSLDSANIVDAGKTLTAYLAPGPKDESGPHRYLFCLFGEPEGFKLEKADVGGEEFVDRRSFGIEEFVKKHGLELAGVQWMRGVGDGWVESGKDEL